MNQTPLVSIVIPTYNRAHVIENTLDSIIDQTYTNWECIVVDDGSTDHTVEIIADYIKKDNRFRFYKRPQDIIKGPSASRNFGYEQSKGEYIQWFDSDDLMHPDKLKLKLEYALKHNADVIIDKHSENRILKNIPDFQVDFFTSSDFYIDFLLGKKPIITNDVMVKAIKIGSNRFDENLFKGEEYEFYSRIFQQELTYCFIDVALTHYRISLDSISISPKQADSLIFLSKKLQNKHKYNELIVNKAKRLGIKTYKNLVMRRKLNMLFKHLNFFRKVHDKSVAFFLLFICYNLVTGRGFDIIKPKK